MKSERFTSQGFANTLNAMSKFDHSVFDVLCVETLTKAGSINSQDIANTLNAMFKLDH